MELWWIVLAGCAGGLLLLAYVAVVVYKMFRHKRRVQMNQNPDPERFTDDKDWTAHVSASEVSERRADGLCMDTLSGSTKLRRKSSMPSVSQIPGAPEEVPVVSPQTKPADKQTGSSPEPQALANASHLEKEAEPHAPKNSPEVVQRSEYTWETLLRRPSGIRKKRSRSLNADDPECRRTSGTASSMKFDRNSQARRFVRSKSLRGYTQRELAILSSDGTVPFDKVVISVKRESEQTKRKNSKKRSPKAQQTATEGRKEVKKAEAKENTKISRSGSAPALRAKEKVEKNEVEGIPRRRNNSFRWIPEPDYQAVSIEELVSAAGQQEKAANEDNVCVVEIHSVPTGHEPNVSTSIGTDIQVVDGSLSASIQQLSPPREDETNSSTIVDIEPILPVPGIARRVPTILNQQKSDENEETQTSIDITRERKLSVKNRAQNFETQIAQAEANSRQFQEPLQRDYTPNTVPPSATDINNNTKTLSNWRQKQTASEVREPTTNTTQAGQPSYKSQPDARSIGKMTIVKHEDTLARRENPKLTTQYPVRQDPPVSKMTIVKHADTSARRENPKVTAQSSGRQDVPVSKMTFVKHVEKPPGNREAAPPNPIRQDPSMSKMTFVKHVETPAGNTEVAPQNPKSQDPPMSFDRAPSTQVRQLQETTLARNTTVLLRREEEQRQNETSNAPLAAPPPPPPPPHTFTVNPRSSDQAMGNGVMIVIESKDNQVAGSEKSKETNMPRRDADVNLTLEDKKKTWKKEQIMDQLHSARARNANQNYIFGTGLAYQSCMPELQNKLKQLALAK